MMRFLCSILFSACCFIPTSDAFSFSLASVPKGSVEEKKVLDKLEQQEKKIAVAVKRMTALEKSNAESMEKRKQLFFSSSKAGNGSPTKVAAKQVSLEKSMQEWDEKMARLNRKSRIGAVNVLSKLRNAIHLVKKGALTGKNKEAKAQLQKLMQHMGQMAA
ncbi:unnamed protein product [Amoebophrya sp. A25]|nr:unnamed protein product [Amoebophrya sp. A25]|eukprot:GSA25T00003054001.1